MGFIDSYRRGYMESQYERFKEQNDNSQPKRKKSNWISTILVFLISWFIIKISLNTLFGQMMGLYSIPMLGNIFLFFISILSILLGIAIAYSYKTGNSIFSITSFLFKRSSNQTVSENTTTQNKSTKKQDPAFILKTEDNTLKEIHLYNTERGVLILGGAGSGKSASIIEPLILQSIAKGFTGLLYDFKFPTLANIAYTAHKVHQSNVKTYYINFQDLTRSHRVNPLHPDTMPTQNHADEYARAILYNLKPESIKKSDFWIDSAHSYLTALIWFLREEYPQYCTLPHVMALAFQPTADVVALLSSNPETSGTIASLREAVQRKAEGQTAGVVSTLQTALRRVNTKEIVWVLSGDDFILNVNDPDAPKFIMLGNAPTLSNTFGPVIALLTTVALKQMNQQDKVPSVVILDEAPTLFIPDFDSLPATGRSNKISTIFSAQDISQIEDMYGKTKKDTILANLNNQFYGRVGHRETAQYICDLWGAHYIQQISRSMNAGRSDSGTSVTDSTSITEQRRNRIEMQEILDLKTGEFYGQIVESEVTSFKVKMKRHENEVDSMPAFNVVSPQEMKDNFARIQNEVKDILGSHISTTSRNTLTPKPGINGHDKSLDF